MFRQVAVATGNKGKLMGVERALLRHRDETGDDFNIIAHSTESGVADTPLSDEEGLIGCANRIEAIERLYPDAELHIALEGILARVNDLWVVRGWTMIKDQSRGRLAIACGAAVQIPGLVATQISSGEQFSEKVRDIYAVTTEEADELRDVGANGVFSGGEYTRQDTFYDGVRICMASLANDRNWPEA